jgi:ribosomal protein S18 acetylase RimI-like enzyme
MMETPFTRAEPADADLLVPLMRDFYAHERMEFDEAVARRALGQLLGDERLGRVYLMRAGAETVGYLVLTFGFSLEFGGRDAFVDEIFVRDEWRGRGAGRRALELAARVCREAGVRALHLEVDHVNPRAQALYRAAGFKDHDRYLMTKPLC